MAEAHADAVAELLAYALEDFNTQTTLHVVTRPVPHNRRFIHQLRTLCQVDLTENRLVLDDSREVLHVEGIRRVVSFALKGFDELYLQWHRGSRGNRRTGNRGAPSRLLSTQSQHPLSTLMSLSDWPAAHRKALARFYAAGHIWTWQQMRDGDGNAAVHARRWIETSPAPPEHPLLLPRLRGEQSIWYAIAFDDRRFEALREELNAFLGSAGTDFNGMRAELDLNDPAEAVLAEWPGPRRVFRLNVIDKERKNAFERRSTSCSLFTGSGRLGG